MHQTDNPQSMNPSLRTITVTGNGKVVAPANSLQLQIEVVTRGDDVTEAQQQNALRINRVIQSIVLLNIPRENIQTAIYSITPIYDYVEGKQEYRGFEVRNAIAVKVTDINHIGTVIDTAVKNGANRVSSLQFSIVNPDLYYLDALRLALQNAQKKARTMANTMKLTLHPQPIEITEESNQSSPVYYKSLEISEQYTPTIIEQGQLTVNATVQVKFQY